MITKNNNVMRIVSVLVLSGILTFASAFVLNSHVTINAQEEAGGSGLSISPTRTELSVLPGGKDTVTVSLRNITSGSINVEIFVDDFEPDNETGEPRLITDDRESAASISGFVSPVENVNLQPEETEDVVLDVNVPSDAAPGGYYGAIRFKAVPADGSDPSESNEVSLTANVLSLVLIEVPGEIETQVSVNSVKAYLDDTAGGIFTQKPNIVGIEIENLGNSFIKPFGTVVVSDFRGNQVFTYELNDSNPRSNVLPKSKRIYKDPLENVEVTVVNGQEVRNSTSPITSPGRYTIIANVSYGNGGEVFTVKTTFWYLPTWFLLTIFAVLAVLIGAAFYLYRKYVTKSTKKRK